MAKYEIYTDGSAKGNAYNQVGGWGLVVIKDDVEILRTNGSKYPSTNNEMELTAILKGLLFIKQLDKNSFGDSFNLYTDSNYSLQSLTNWYKNWQINGWKNSKKEPVKNKELIQDNLALLEEMPYVNLIKVKGHSDNFYNNIADKMATEASDKEKQRLILEELKQDAMKRGK